MKPDRPALTIHGHFYQPPRENPWTGMVDKEPGAQPFRDWNERTHDECYRANAFARVTDAYGRIERIVNSYALISFNIGPTLLSWIERHHRDTYARILAADRDSQRRCGGHGNAIAQGYNHAILPLCNDNDRRTQIRWGIADFRHRFGRMPEALWLPETACNDATLGALIDEGLTFAILSPHQAERVRPLSGGEESGEWRQVDDGSIDPSVAYRYFHRDGSGRSIALFFYDGPMANAIAFEGLLTSSSGLVSQEGYSQGWRTPLRQALDHLRDEAARQFSATAAELFADPWHTRDRYIDLILDPDRPREPFLQEAAGRHLREAEQVRALTFLELMRCAMLMYTSCGFFFADISGIEAVQALKYAGRVLDYFDELDLPSPREGFLDILAGAHSNLPEMGSGADIFRRFVEPCRVAPSGVAAHLALTDLLSERDVPDQGEIAGCAFVRKDRKRLKHGRVTLSTARLSLTQRATLSRHDYAVAAIHFGGIDFSCFMRPFSGLSRYRAAETALWSIFRTASLPALLRRAGEQFGPDEYGLEQVLPDGRERIASAVFGDLEQSFAEQYARLYEDNRRVLEMLQEAGFELPPELRAAAEFTLGRRFEREIQRQGRSRDPAAYQRAIEIAEEVARRGYRIDRSRASHIFSDMIARAIQLAVTEPTEENIDAARDLLALSERLGLDPSLQKPQEALYEALTAGPAPRKLFDLALRVGLSPVLLPAPLPLIDEQARRAA